MTKKLIVIRDPGGTRDGWWYDLGAMAQRQPGEPPLDGVQFVPTGKYERRYDGAMGEVYVQEAEATSL